MTILEKIEIVRLIGRAMMLVAIGLFAFDLPPHKLAAVMLTVLLYGTL